MKKTTLIVIGTASAILACGQTNHFGRGQHAVVTKNGVEVLHRGRATGFG